MKNNLFKLKFGCVKFILKWHAIAIMACHLYWCPHADWSTLMKEKEISLSTKTFYCINFAKGEIEKIS